MPPILTLSLPNHNPPPPPACNSAFVRPDFFPLHLHPPQLLAPRTASPLPEREPPPAGRVGRPRLPPPLPQRGPPPHGGRGSLRAGRLGAPPPAAHGAARRAAAAAASTRAAAPTRAQPAAGGPGKRAALPNAIAGGRRPGPRHARTRGPAWGGCPGAEGAWPTCGHPRRAGWAAREPGCSGGRGRGGEEGPG